MDPLHNGQLVSVGTAPGYRDPIKGRVTHTGLTEAQARETAATDVHVQPITKAQLQAHSVIHQETDGTWSVLEFEHRLQSTFASSDQPVQMDSLAQTAMAFCSKHGTALPDFQFID